MINDNAGGGLRGLRAELSELLLDTVRETYGINLPPEPVDLGGSSGW